MTRESASSTRSWRPQREACFWRTYPEGGTILGMYPEIEAFAAHLAQVERASAHTQRAYVSDLRQLATFLGERGTALDAATRDDLRAFLASRFSANTAATLARKQASLRAFYEHRVRMGHLADSPARRLVFPRRRLSLPNVVAVDECFAIVDAPSRRTPAGLRERAPPGTCIRTRSGTVSPRTCSTWGPICAASRNCSVTLRYPPPSATPMSRRSTCCRRTRTPTPGRARNRRSSDHAL